MIRNPTLAIFSTGALWIAGFLEAEESTIHLDSFDTDASLEAWLPTQPDRWKITDGALNLLGVSKKYQPPFRSPHSITLLKDKVVGDFVLTAKVKTLQSARGHRDMCIFWGWQDPAKFYYVHLGEKPDPNSSQIFIVNEAARTPITKTNQGGIPWEDGEWHAVKVVRKVESGLIEVYFDDMTTPAKTAVDTTFGWGLIGLGSFDDLGMWDDVRIDGQLLDGKKTVLPAPPRGQAANSAPKPVEIGKAIRKVTVDAAQTGNRAANAIDGDESTRWSAEGVGRWIQIELAEPAELSKVGVAFHHAERNYRVDLAMSLDGESWTDSTRVESKGRAGVQLYEIEPARAKFLRITSRGSNRNSWINITEITIPGVWEPAPRPAAAGGFRVIEWANDSRLEGGSAIAVDDHGRVYATNVNRRKESSLDLRNNRDWVKTDLSFRTVDDRRRFYRENLAGRRNLPDRNGDGKTDWRDLTVQSDRIFQVTDRDRDGKGETIVEVGRFHSEITGIAAGLATSGGDLFAAVEPEFLRYTDEDGDGLPETKQVVADGLQVHIGQGGHNLSGVTIGPDGRVYFSLADKGHSLTTKEGKHYHLPNCGAIFRCELDGSGLERFSIGQRNAQELAFDAHGNLFSMDNDGDYPGEMERALYITPESDHGWRLNWQWLGLQDFVKISGTKPYNPWMEEKLFLPDHEAHAAYLTPTIGNFGPGPCGFTANPGTALSESLADKFFLTNNNNRVRVFSFQPNGASFAFSEHQEIKGGNRNTGLAWGPDGSLFAASYQQGSGKIHRFDVAESDVHPLRDSTLTILQKDETEAGLDELAIWLGHADQRVRMKAQFEFVRRGRVSELADAGLASDSRLAKLHAVWGIGQAARADRSHLERLRPFWKSDDPEVLAQACKVTGESGGTIFAAELRDALRNPSIRTRSFAAIALGQTGESSAADNLLEELATDDAADDPYYRHALSLGLQGTQQLPKLANLASHENRTVRLAAIVALRRLGAPEIAGFLNDDDELVLLEAARAIHDDHSIPETLPALAALLEREGNANEALLRRIINAAFRNGEPADLQRLGYFVALTSAPTEMRRVALASILWWSQPPVLDAVEGRYRELNPRDQGPVDRLIAELKPAILAEDELSAVLLNGVIHRQQPQWLGGAKERFAKWPAPLQRKLLQALALTNDPELRSFVELGLASANADVRGEARAHAGKAGIPVLQLLVAVIDDPKATGRGEAVVQLSKIDTPAAKAKVDELIAAYQSGKLAPDIKLEVWEIAAKRGLELPATPDRLTHGGDPKAGKELTINHTVAQCIRCHQIGKPQGGAPLAVGPDLTKIGSQFDRDYLVASILEPNRDIAPGFGMAMIETKSGETISGMLAKQTDEAWTVTLADGAEREVSAGEIATRQLLSVMPPMGMILTEREIRDIVSYLATLK